MMERSAILARLPMPSSYFKLILRSLGASGQQRAQLLAGTGLSEELLHDGTEQISLFQQVQQIENVLHMLGSDWTVAEPELWEPTVHGALGVAVMAAPDVGSMMDVIANYGFVRAPYYEIVQRRTAARSQLVFDLSVPLEEEVWRSLLEVSFIGIHASIARVLPADAGDFVFSFAYPEPPHADRLRSILGTNIHFSAERNGIQVPSAWLSIDSPFSDPILYRFAMTELASAAQRLAVPDNIRARVERLLQALPADRINASEIARATGVSRRTLVRRLSETGCSFRTLVDDELRRRARRLLDDGLTHAKIAAELGYNDPSSFSRARRRWFGSDLN